MKSLMHVLITTLSAAAFACGGNNNTNDRNMASSRSDMPDRNSSAMNDRAAGADGARATVTGCLLAGGDAGSYVLQLAAADTSGNGGTPSSTLASANSAQTYRIISNGSQDLQQNVNKQVAIDGEVSHNAGTGAVGTSGSPGTARSTSEGAGLNPSLQRANGNASGSVPASELPTIRAESVRKVADECREMSTSSGRTTNGK